MARLDQSRGHVFTTCVQPRRTLFDATKPELQRLQPFSVASITVLKVFTTSRSPSSYLRSCADERACQGWRSHHVVTPKAPFTRPVGKSDNCADEEWDGARRRLVGIRFRGDGLAGTEVPARLGEQRGSYADASGLARTWRSIVSTRGQRRAVAFGRVGSRECRRRDLRHDPAMDCRAVRPREGRAAGPDSGAARRACAPP